MNVNDIQTYLRLQKERLYESEGMSTADFEKELGVSKSTAKRFITKEIAAGRLKYNGTRKITAIDGRTNYQPVYKLVPHVTTD